ncbi:MAG TPA: FAD-binding oxidoreductase [Thermoanaerobaculia bacterium]|nr:FAD-binding oxidoreductase [Thermoanaerobaculia bacterium]
MEVLILGAGVIGASVAYHLAARGVRDIVVIDRAEDFGGGSTAKATGGFRVQFDNETEVRLSLLARAKLRAFEEEIGVDSGYRPHGYLFLACNDVELDTLRAAQAVQHACGVSEARMISAGEARELSPAISDDSIAGAAFCPTDGFIRPMNILRGYVSAAQRLGVRFELGVEHLGFRTEGDRVVAARTSRGEMAARVFVNAMGAWSGAPVMALRRNVAATVATDLLPESMPMTIWSGDWYHFRVRDGRVLLLWPDDPPVNDWIEQVQAKTQARVPSVAALPIAETWSGMYEMSPDGRAIVGRSPALSNVYLATGCSGHGVMHAPAIGQLVAELVVDGRTLMDIEALRPDRFSLSSSLSS